MEITLTNTKQTFSVDSEDFEQVSKYNWYLSTHGYVESTINSIRLSRMLLKATSKIEVDHIDNNKLNNHKNNLRFATRSQNNMNRRVRVDSSTQIKGVCFDKRKKTKPYLVQIKADKIRHHIGFFDTIDEAKQAYKEAAIKYHGKFAKFE